MTFASMADDFAAAGCALLGLSIDSNPSHIAWSRAMEHYTWNGIKNPQITFPIVADDMGEVARLYGMLMPSASATRTVRNVFFIDTKGVVRAILVYPLSTGRNMNEIMRLLLALQAYDRTGNATPADWMPGDPQILPAPKTLTAAQNRLDDEKQGGYSCLDWYICFTKGSDNKDSQTNMPENKRTAGSKLSSGNAVKENKSEDKGGMNAARQSSDMNTYAAGSGTLDMSEIMRILGAGAVIPNIPSKPNPPMPNPMMPKSSMPNPPMPNPMMPKSSMPNPPMPKSHTLKSKSNQQKSNHYSYGGIMEQNRKMYSSAEKRPGTNEYRITRDYPNDGK